MIIPDWLKQAMVTMLIPSIALVYSYAKIEFEVDRNAEAIGEVKGILKERQAYLNESFQLKKDVEKLQDDMAEFLPVVRELSGSLRELNVTMQATNKRLERSETDIKEIKDAVTK